MAPFSGKQKKEQLKAKREKKREANERRHQREAEDEQRELHSTAMEMARNNRQQVDDAGSSTSSHSHCESDGCEPHKDARKARPPRRVDPQASLEEKSEEMKYGADRKGIRSVFAKESSAQVEERKRLTYEPLHHRLMMAKTGIAFGRWFAMPHDAELLVSEDKKKQRTRRRRATSSSESDVDDAEAEERKTDASEKQTEEPSLVRPSPLGDAASHSWISSAGGSMAFPISVELPSRGWKVNSEGEIVETSTGYMDNTRRMKEGDEDSLHQRDVDLEALDAAHYESYLRALDKVQLPDHLRGLELSNYERNLDVWRQMWRTVEISDVVVLVADARYPIIHLPISLLTYITRTCHKPCVAVLNKSDLVPPSTLQSWLHFLTRYLRLAGLNVMESPTPATPDTWRDHLRTGWNGPTGAAPLVFATFTADPQLNKPLNVGDGAAYTRRPKLKRRAKFYEVLHEDLRQRMGKGAALEADSSGEEDEDERSGTHYDRCERFKGMKEAERNLSDVENPAVLGAVANALIRLLLPCRALTDIFREQHPHEPHPVHAEESVEAPPMVASHLPVAAARRAKRKTTKQKRTAKMQSTRAIEEESSDEGTEDDRSSDEVLDDRFPDDLRYAHLGFIGYPNVGKSSLLNCLRGAKVVSVSATAGHTKHLQTIPIPSQHITLVDCPGLVFPVFGIPRPLQAIVGSHQIAQTRDPQSSVAYLATHIPLEKLYGLQRPDGENEGDEPWTPYDLCEAYARKRGYFVKRGKGVPDVHRASLSILQEAFDGQLTIFFAPPELNLLDSQVFQAALAPWLSLSVQQQKNTSNDNVLEES